MPNPDDILAELTEVSAYIAKHIHLVPPERRVQALANLGSVEKLLSLQPKGKSQ